VRTRTPGTLGPYGDGPARPAALPVSEPGDVAVGATIIVVIGFVSLSVPIGLIGGLVLLLRKRRGSGWTTAAKRPAQLTQPPGALRRSLASLRAWDPDFSVAIFEDFAYALYAEAHTARGQGTLQRLTPYLGANARATLDAQGRRPVSAVVVGAMRYVGFDPNGAGGQRVEVLVEFEACYTEAQSQSFYAMERWRFVRARSARSRAPDKARVLHCPHCGAPLDRIVGGSCGYCNTVVDGGAFDWTVETIEVCERNPVPPVLTGTGEEAGTHLPTLFAPDLGAGLAGLRARDPSFDQNGLFARLQLMFGTMQMAWSSLAWEGARPYLSDGLFETNAYWMAAYRAQGLRNITQNARITGLELVRVDSDRWFDAVTVRVHATGLDYTIREADRAVVGGHPQRERAYTEYWTLLRGTSRQGPAKAEPVCPNCGAALKVSMAALCTHCGVKVNSGAFDWVLSRIEQDEVYSG
jgi:ribosomal protein L37AE/L43A